MNSPFCLMTPRSIMSCSKPSHSGVRTTPGAIPLTVILYLAISRAAAWVSEMDEAAVRNTRDVDILLRRADLDRAKEALAKAGFIYRHAASIDMFLDGPDAKARDALHILFAGEKVRKDDPLEAPDVVDSKSTATFRVVNLEPLVRMKLTANRRKDQMHLLDMLDVGLIDASWRDRLPPVLADRLQALIDNPEG